MRSKIRNPSERGVFLRILQEADIPWSSHDADPRKFAPVDDCVRENSLESGSFDKLQSSLEIWEVRSACNRIPAVLLVE